MADERFFPDMIADLPAADLPIPGVSSHLLQAERQQVIFMSFEADVEVPDHSHEAQWGVVLAGEMELTVEGMTCTFKRGDTYYIPKDARHSARIAKGYRDLTLFNQKDRYRPLQG